MAIEKMRAQLVSAIWQGVAQSGVDLSALPAADQEKLVSQITDKVLITVDDWIGKEATSLVGAISQNDDPSKQSDEQVLWVGRPFLSLVESYTITTERLIIVRGLLTRHVENYELIRIQDIDMKQGVGERMVNVGDIVISGHDSSEPQVVLNNISKPDEVYEILRKAWMEARKRHGLQFREYM